MLPKVWGANCKNRTSPSSDYERLLNVMLVPEQSNRWQSGIGERTRRNDVGITGRMGAQRTSGTPAADSRSELLDSSKNNI